MASILFLLLSPLSPAVLIYINKKRERQLNINAKTLGKLDPTQTKQRLKLFQERINIDQDKKNIETLLSTSYKLDNVLENTPQLLIQFLIILISASWIKLEKVQGIEAVFDKHDSDNR